MSDLAKNFLTPNELAMQWRCTSHHVRALVRSGQLRGFRVGSKMLVDAKDAAAYLERNTTATPQAA